MVVASSVSFQDMDSNTNLIITEVYFCTEYVCGTHGEVRGPRLRISFSPLPWVLKLDLRSSGQLHHLFDILKGDPDPTSRDSLQKKP